MTELRCMEEIMDDVMRPEVGDQLKRLHAIWSEMMGMILTSNSSLVREALSRIAFDIEDGIKNGM
jgi:hypothetical protein